VAEVSVSVKGRKRGYAVDRLAEMEGHGPEGGIYAGSGVELP
jgi:hypothetical protein